MRRVGNLWDEVTSFENLLGAAKAAAAGKRKRRDVASFEMELEPELARLRRELIDGAYQPGTYRNFRVHDGKPRLISAAPFRDRVVHHALTRVLEPIFERRFSNRSYACRKGLGTHRAIDAAKFGMRRYEYVLKCDVRKYFASIDHAILNQSLARAIKCRPTLALAAKIVGSWQPAEGPTPVYFKGDHLFTPLERRCGLPLGNQTSQFFANVYLDPLDRWAGQAVGNAFIRYVDDFLVFGDSKTQLSALHEGIQELLERLRLRLHEGKSRVYRTDEGVTFLGWRLFPGRACLERGNVIRFRRRLRGLQKGYAEGGTEWEDMEQRVRAWIAHAAHGNTLRLREKLFEQFTFGRRAIISARGRLEQRNQEPPRSEP